MLKIFEDLDVWKRASQLAVDICVATKPIRDFSLKDQLRRASISIPSNIAKGSCSEFRTQLYIS
ncbi:MAG: four helix bundle protein [Chthoniobacterales bacterium]